VERKEATNKVLTNQNALMNQLAPSAGLKLENQVAVVTGGARGIGAGIVRRFVEEGDWRIPQQVVRRQTIFRIPGGDNENLLTT
jgi:hypothetical protein